ncbi:MAG: DUF4292 domain-containing protein [Bacteroidales bacterium]|nr:DUF4292 domain-containing protein [Bacteroidales bacterium]
MIDRNLFWKLGMFLTIIFMAACSSSKKAVESGVLGYISSHDYFNSLIDNELQYTTFLCKMNVEIRTNGKSISSKATLKLQRDRVMQISFQPIAGIEMFRLQLTPDSVIAINRMNRWYVAENLTSLTNAGFDFNGIQSLFTNKLFIPDKKNLSASDHKFFDIKRQGNGMLLTLNASKQMSYVFIGDANSHIATATLNGNVNNFFIDWKYTSFSLFNNIVFPSKMNISAAIEKKQRIDVACSISSIETDLRMDVNTTIPTKYSRIGVNDFLNLFNL